MRSNSLRRLANALVAPALVASMATALVAGERHLTLVKSEPANSATVVKAPKAITLWFSQRPNIKLTRVVLTHDADTIKTAAVVVADTSGKQVRASIATPLVSGKYQVMWRTVSRDGHAVMGKLAFTVDSSSKPLNISSVRR